MSHDLIAAPGHGLENFRKGSRQSDQHIAAVVGRCEDRVALFKGLECSADIGGLERRAIGTDQHHCITRLQAGLDRLRHALAEIAPLLRHDDPAAIGQAPEQGRIPRRQHARGGIKPPFAPLHRAPERQPQRGRQQPPIDLQCAIAADRGRQTSLDASGLGQLGKNNQPPWLHGCR